MTATKDTTITEIHGLLRALSAKVDALLESDRAAARLARSREVERQRAEQLATGMARGLPTARRVLAALPPAQSAQAPRTARKSAAHVSQLTERPASG